MVFTIKGTITVQVDDEQLIVGEKHFSSRTTEAEEPEAMTYAHNIIM